MYKKSGLAKLELILKYINDINIIIENHHSIEAALSDMEGEYALLMCLTQIGETVNKLSETKILDALPVSKIIGLRNRIVHGYEDIDKRMVSEILNHHIPELGKIITGLIENQR